MRPERDFPNILRLHAEGRLPLERLVTHRLPLTRTGEALDLVRTGQAVRAVLLPNSDSPDDARLGSPRTPDSPDYPAN